MGGLRRLMRVLNCTLYAKVDLPLGLFTTNTITTAITAATTAHNKITTATTQHTRLPLVCAGGLDSGSRALSTSSTPSVHLYLFSEKPLSRFSVETGERELVALEFKELLFPLIALSRVGPDIVNTSG